MIKALLIFLGTMLLDFVWGRSIRAMSEAVSPLKAGFWGGTCTAIQATVIVSIGTDYILLLPLWLGGFTGIYLSKCKWVDDLVRRVTVKK